MFSSLNMPENGKTEVKTYVKLPLAFATSNIMIQY